jgi:hypothetical protein
MVNHVLNDGTVLKTGSHYMVKHEKNKRAVRRIYKYSERRFKSILCFVFSSKVRKDTTLIKKGNIYYWHGTQLPESEISIPYYDLIECKLIN